MLAAAQNNAHVYVYVYGVVLLLRVLAICLG